MMPEQTSVQPRAIGILGGTFDPIHYAHLRLAEEARQQLDLQNIRLIPAGQPKHREQPGTCAQDRLSMVNLAAKNIPGFTVDAAEVLSDQPSYTVLTLERLRRELAPQQALVLVLGTDAFLELHHWHRWQDLFRLAHIAIATRPGYSLELDKIDTVLRNELNTRLTVDHEVLHQTIAGAICCFTITPLTISATAIRAQLATHMSPRFLLPDAVLNYIQEKHLYLTNA